MIYACINCCGQAWCCGHCYYVSVKAASDMLGLLFFMLLYISHAVVTISHLCAGLVCLQRGWAASAMLGLMWHCCTPAIYV